MSDELMTPVPDKPRHTFTAPWYSRRAVQVFGALVLGLGLGVVVGATASSGGGDSSAEHRAAVAAEASKLAEARATEEAAAEAQASALAEQQQKAAAPPPPSAFKLTVKTLKKDCFGSAGCNVTYRVVPKFVGPGDPSNLEVTYVVTGGEDGPVVSTFTVDSAGTASYDSENTISTPSSRTVLRARVTQIERAP